MFQSSRIAVGIADLQASSAFSPSSASTISNPNSSRMRRAIFRTTLESSTTRHVFIFRSSFLRAAHLPIRLCGEHRRWHDFEDAIDVEDDHELTVEAMDAAGELGHAGIEVDGVFLAAVVGQPENLSDLVDQEPVGLAAQIDAHR